MKRAMHAVLGSSAAALRSSRCAASASVGAHQQRRWLQVATNNTDMVFDIKGEFVEGRSTFLDNQSTTAMDPRVLDAMMPLMTWQYGNPHSRSVLMMLCFSELFVRFVPAYVQLCVVVQSTQPVGLAVCACVADQAQPGA